MDGTLLEVGMRSNGVERVALGHLCSSGVDIYLQDLVSERGERGDDHGGKLGVPPSGEKF